MPATKIDKKWYVVHTYSGFENKAKKSLEEKIKQNALEEYFGDILIPMENVVEMVKGEKPASKRKFFPGYILVQMVLAPDLRVLGGHAGVADFDVAARSAAHGLGVRDELDLLAFQGSVQHAQRGHERSFASKGRDGSGPSLPAVAPGVNGEQERLDGCPRIR